MSHCVLSNLVSIEKLLQSSRVFNSTLKGRFSRFLEEILPLNTFIL